MHRVGKHAQRSRPVRCAPTCTDRTSLVGRLWREHRRRRLIIRLGSVTMADQLAYWRARRWTL